MVATFEQLRTKKPTAFDELRAKPPDYGMIALPREELPGVWKYNEQLESLLGDPDKDIEDFIPLDVKYDFGRIIGMTEKPDETKDKMASSLFYSVELGMPPSVSFNILDELNKIAFDESIPASTAWGRIKQRYRTGKAQVQLMDMGYNILRGTWQDWEEYERSVKNIEKLQSGMTIDQAKEFRNFFEKLVGASAELTPFALEAAKEMPLGAGIGGTLFGVGAALASIAIPTVGEEALVPPAALAGIKVGAGVRGAMRIAQLEAGGMFLEIAQMKDQYGNRIDPKIAVIASHSVGAINGGIELAEWQVLLGTFGIGKKLFDKSVRKVTHRLFAQGTVKELIARKALDYSIALGAETLQEIEQETTNVVFGELAKELNNARKGTDFKPITAEALTERYREVTFESMRAFGLMVLPGTMISGALELVSQKAEAAVEKIEKPAEIKVPSEITEMTDDELYEKFRATKITEPEWKTLYEEVVRRKEAEKAPTEAIVEPEKPTKPITKPEAVEVAQGIIRSDKTDLPLYDQWMARPDYAREAKGVELNVEWMTPDEYISRVAELQGITEEETLRHIDKGSQAYLRKQVEEGKQLDMPVLDYKVKTQEGRNRAILAKEMGQEKIPVLVITEAQPPTEAKAEPTKAKTIAERQDTELIERWAELDSIEKARRKPQEIKELREIEDELIKKHPPEAIEKDITEKARKRVIKETEEEIQSSDLYRDALQYIEEQQQALPPIQYIIARTKEKIPGEIKDYIGEPGTKGYKGYLWKYLTTYEENPNATGWDEAHERVGGRPGDIGEFIERLDQTIQLAKGKATISQQALDIAIGQGDLHAEIISAKYEMLKEGFSATEINDAIRQIATKEGIDIEMAEGYYLPIEVTKDVKTKQQILRELLRESQKAKRKVQRPSLEEAAIRKATEIAHKTKEEQYVYERTGKDAGLFAVSKKPPTEGAYKRITPPQKGELTGKVTEEYAGLTPEEKVSAKKLRQKIHAVAINKGLTKKALSELKKKHTGFRRLTGKVASKKITTEQLQNLLKAVQKARPKQVGYKKVITRKTEKKIQSLKENLTKKTQMTEGHFKDILEKEVHGKEPKYVDAKNFITETQGKDILRRMLDAAEIIRLTESFEQAIAKNPEIADRVKLLDSRIDKAPKRDPYSLESMRYYNQQAQIKTGAPIFTSYMDLIDTHLDITKTRTAIWKRMEKTTDKFKEIAKDEEALQRVSDYIASQSTLKEKPAMPKDITVDEKKLAKEIQKILKEYRIKVRVAKFYNWYYYNQPIPDHDRYTKEITKAVDIYESKGREELIEYLDTQEWGVVHSGYEPLDILFHKVKPYTTGATSVGKGHVKIRTDIEYHRQERNILQRLSSYMRQIDMLYNLSPKINAYVRLFDDNASKFSDWGKVKNDIEIFLRNLKRYNIEGGFFERMIARAYSQAMRVIIMPSPVLAYRNLHQNFSFETDKSILIDPRNTNLTSSDIEYLETYVLQTRAMVEEYFMVGEKPLPGLKFLTELIDKVKIYPWSDIANRHWSFWAKTNQVDRALKAETIKQMMTEAKFEDMKELEQRRALGILARDGKEAMTQYVGRVHVDDIHFLYERAQRSPAEMTSLGKIVGNLMLFSRAYGEKLAHSANKTLKGKTYEEQWRGLKTIFAVVGGGMIVGSLYMKVTGRKRNPYNPLEILAFRPGGLAWASIEIAGEVYSTMLMAIKGDKKALYQLTSMIPRLADMFIPFYDYTLRAIEAATDRKNIDRQALREILSMIDKEYKVRGGDYKVKRNALEKWQYFISGPSAEKEITEVAKPKKITR